MVVVEPLEVGTEVVESGTLVSEVVVGVDVGDDTDGFEVVVGKEVVVGVPTVVVGTEISEDGLSDCAIAGAATAVRIRALASTAPANRRNGFRKVQLPQ